MLNKPGISIFYFKELFKSIFYIEKRFPQHTGATVFL